MKCQAKDCEKDATALRRTRPGTGNFSVKVCDEHAAAIDAGKPPTSYDSGRDMPTAS
jgi:hypothetical protein